MKKNYSFVITTLLLFLFGTSQLKATDYYLKSGVGAITTNTNWGTNTDGTGTTPTNFLGAHVWHFANRATVSIVASAFGAPSTATSIIESGMNLTVGGLVGALNTVINISASGTLTIGRNASFNLNNMDVASTVVYNSSAAAVKTPTNLSSYGNVVIAVSTVLDGTNGDTHIAGVLTINASRTFTISGYPLYLDGASTSIAGTGNIYGDGNCGIVLSNGGGGNNGTLNFATGGQFINTFLVQYNTPSDIITIGTNFTVTGTGFYVQNTGSIDLSGRRLTIDNTSDVNFPAAVTDGYIRSNSVTVIEINGTVGGTTGGNTMFMDPTNNNASSLLLNSNAQTLILGNALSIRDSVKVTDGTLNANGNLTLEADNTKTARIAEMGATGSITGNVTVETIAKAGLTGWTNLGVSGITGQTLSNWDGQIPMTCENCTYGVTGGGNYFESVQGWDEPNDTYDTTISASTALSVGRGFWVYLGNGFTSTSDITWSVTGPVNQAAGLIGITQGVNGFNLLANPYPSPISWSKFYNLSANSVFINPSAYVYNPDGPGFSTFTDGVGVNGASEVLQAGQGFFVEATAGTANLDYDETMKVDRNTYASNPLLRSSSANKPNYGEVFKLRVKGLWGDKDEMAFRIHPSATASFDKRWDAKKIFVTPGYAGYPGTYSKYTSVSAKDAQDKDYAIISFPAPTQSITVPVLVKASASGNYTLSAAEFDNYTGCIILHDKLSNTYKDLRKGDYVFYMNDSTATPRFEMVFCENGVAPLSVPALNTASTILISQDKDGVFVQTAFEQSTKATISAYNIIGQQLMKDIIVEGTDTYNRLNIDANSQVIIIRVTTDKESVTKKIITK